MANAEQSEMIAGFTKKLTGFFRIRTGDPAQSDDLAQETMIRVARAADSDPTKLNPSYVHRSGINAFLNFQRDQSRLPPIDSLDRPGTYEVLPNVQDTEDEVAARVHLREVLSALPSLLRDVEYQAVDLVILNGLSYEAAGEQMQLKGSQVKDLVFKARKKLKKSFPND